MSKKIIFDTDLGGDIDDGGALALVHKGIDKGVCDLLCVTSSTTNPYSVGAIDAINKYYRHEVPIGVTKIVPHLEKINREEFLKNTEKWYGKYICENYPHSYENDEAPDAIRLLRKVLSESITDKDEEKITMVVIGTLVNIRYLLESKADEYSELDGISLMKKSVKELSIMACFFPSDELRDVWFGDYHMVAESNIIQDIESSQIVFKKSPVPIVLSHFTLGRMAITGEDISKESDLNPVSACYKKFFNGVRDSWDTISAYYAVYGLGDIFELDKPCVVSIDDKGVSSFAYDENGNHYLIRCPSYEKAKQALNKAMVE